MHVQHTAMMLTLLSIDLMMLHRILPLLSAFPLIPMLSLRSIALSQLSINTHNYWHCRARTMHAQHTAMMLTLLSIYLMMLHRILPLLFYSLIDILHIPTYIDAAPSVFIQYYSFILSRSYNRVC